MIFQFCFLVGCVLCFWVVVCCSVWFLFAFATQEILISTTANLRIPAITAAPRVQKELPPLDVDDHLRIVMLQRTPTTGQCLNHHQRNRLDQNLFKCIKREEEELSSSSWDLHHKPGEEPVAEPAGGFLTISSHAAGTS